MTVGPMGGINMLLDSPADVVRVPALEMCKGSSSVSLSLSLSLAPWGGPWCLDARSRQCSLLYLRLSDLVAADADACSYVSPPFSGSQPASCTQLR